MGLDITGYGNYGWATTTPVRNIADAKKVKIRIAEAAVNKLTYEAWGFNPVVMPWPDVPRRCSAESLRVWIIRPWSVTSPRSSRCANTSPRSTTPRDFSSGFSTKRGFDKLPTDLQKTFKEVVNEVCADIRVQTRAQEADQIANAKESGVEFIKLSDEDMATLKNKADVVHKEYAEEIGPEYLKKVEEFMEYK